MGTSFGGAVALALLAFALGGCGSSDLLKSSSLDVFSSSPKPPPPGEPPPAGAPAPVATASVPDNECPDVSVRTGASTLVIGSKPGEGEPAALDVRYQGSIIRTARECRITGGVMTMNIGIEGRVITGPAGGPGTVDVPLRIAVVHEGVNPKTVVSKFGREAVTIAGTVDRATFTHVEPDIAFPVPQPMSTLEQYVVYVGFDPVGAQPEKKPPPAKRKPAKRKPS